jgi:hypothetical protein
LACGACSSPVAIARVTCTHRLTPENQSISFSVISIVLCGKFPETKCTDSSCFDVRSPASPAPREREGNVPPPAAPTDQHWKIRASRQRCRTRGPSLSPFGGPRGVGVFLCAMYPCSVQGCDARPSPVAIARVTFNVGICALQVYLHHKKQISHSTTIGPWV